MFEPKSISPLKKKIYYGRISLSFKCLQNHRINQLSIGLKCCDSGNKHETSVETILVIKNFVMLEMQEQIMLALRNVRFFK